METLMLVRSPQSLSFHLSLMAIAVSATLSAAAREAEVDQAPTATVPADGSAPASAVVEIKGVRSSNTKTIATKRDSIAMIDTIAADEIGKLPDFNVGDVLKRVTGVATLSYQGEPSRLFAAIESALLQSAERADGSCAWRTRLAHISPSSAEEKRRERYDLGVAHGTPAMIGLFSHAERLGIATPNTSQLLADCLDWLRKKEETTLGYSNFQSMLSASGPAFPSQWTRLAWCYGDLGIAAMLAVSQHEEGCRRASWWRRLAGNRLSQPASSFQLGSTGLCHGSGGVLHVLRGLQAQGWHSPDADALATRLEADLVSAANALDDSPSHCLLEGWSGSLLALVESLVASRDPGRPWNLCLLTPA
jgi:hypothetical protein